MLIDAGANVKCPPEYLIQFAYMGSYYAEHVLGRPQPKVGLLNIGVEPSKGTELQTTVYPLLKQVGRRAASASWATSRPGKRWRARWMSSWPTATQEIFF